jgi:excisionase family DNA binding protein
MPQSLMTVAEAAALLRTTAKAIYTMIERGQLPGVVRLGRRVLVRRADLRRHVGLDAVGSSQPGSQPKDG